MNTGYEFKFILLKLKTKLFMKSKSLSFPDLEFKILILRIIMGNCCGGRDQNLQTLVRFHQWNVYAR